MLSVAEIKLRHGHQIGAMLHNVLELGKTMSSIEQAMLADGRLVMDADGNCWWSEKSKTPGRRYSLA